MLNRNIEPAHIKSTERMERIYRTAFTLLVLITSLKVMSLHKGAFVGVDIRKRSIRWIQGFIQLYGVTTKQVEWNNVDVTQASVAEKIAQ